MVKKFVLLTMLMCMTMKIFAQGCDDKLYTIIKETDSSIVASAKQIAENVVGLTALNRRLLEFREWQKSPANTYTNVGNRSLNFKV